MAHNITLIPGDGIGPEVADATARAVEATGVAVEWEREATAEKPAITQPPAEVPFGLKVAGDCAHLEEDTNEREVLVAMMELTIQDGPYSSIAEELNRRGFRTREGVRWTPVSVFQMLPRLIEVGPRIFNSLEWQERRQRMSGK